MGFVMNLLKLIGFLMVFASVLFLIYVFTRFIGKKAKSTMKGKYINVVETVSLGFDKSLHLIKVADNFVLIATCGKSVEYLTSLDIKYDEDESDDTSILGSFDFKSIFEKYKNSIMNKNKKNDKTNLEFDEKIVKEEKFKNNLGKLKKITKKTNDKVDGDDA
jgi:flagellar protein FliO/FliZ